MFRIYAIAGTVEYTNAHGLWWLRHQLETAPLDDSEFLIYEG